MILQLLEEAPRLVEIVMLKIQTEDEKYDYSWHRGDELLKIQCTDGIAVIYYVPWDHEPIILEEE